MRGDSLEEVAASEPNSSFLFRGDGYKAQLLSGKFADLHGRRIYNSRGRRRF